RTSDVCKSLNGKIFKIKDAKVGINCPPLHPFCRSTLVVVLD
ncbi:MAG: minor capsid protein, partial [Fusobacteriaceae bacterium]